MCGLQQHVFDRIGALVAMVLQFLAYQHIGQQPGLVTLHRLQRDSGLAQRLHQQLQRGRRQMVLDAITIGIAAVARQRPLEGFVLADIELDHQRFRGQQRPRHLGRQRQGALLADMNGAEQVSGLAVMADAIQGPMVARRGQRGATALLKAHGVTVDRQAKSQAGREQRQ